jgi:hypothetical protein
MGVKFARDEADDLAFEAYREQLLLERWENCHERFAKNICCTIKS